ncbi:CHRD domain-containing protein [Novosphingobium bradum]|uniref:CHRD domain-containing protein n=1 Tax=Novosphingobium bradum TaxID=1737444 RepID=A0ABV7ILN3_9SPHN
MIRNAIVAASPLALLAGLFAAGPALAAPIKLSATLTGPAETPPGKPDGTGGFTVTVDPGTNDFCYSLWAEKIGKPTMAHLHAGAAGASGPPILTLDVTGKDSDECLAVDKEKLDPIVANPAGYYVNVHTAEFPAGAVRGQLAK